MQHAGDFFLPQRYCHGHLLSGMLQGAGMFTWFFRTIQRQTHKRDLRRECENIFHSLFMLLLYGPHFMVALKGNRVEVGIPRDCVPPFIMEQMVSEFNLAALDSRQYNRIRCTRATQTCRFQHKQFITSRKYATP